MASRSSRHRATSQTPSHEDEFGCVPAVLQRTDSSRRHVPARGGNGIGGPCQQPRAVSPKGRCSHRWLRHNAERGAFPIATSIAVGTPVSRGPRADPDVHSHASGSCLRSNGKPRSLPYPLDRLGHASPPLCAVLPASVCGACFGPTNSLWLRPFAPTTPHVPKDTCSPPS